MEQIITSYTKQIYSVDEEVEHFRPNMAQIHPNLLKKNLLFVTHVMADNHLNGGYLF